MKYKKLRKILVPLMIVCMMIMDVTLASAAMGTQSSIQLLSGQSAYAIATDKADYLVGEPIKVTASAPSGSEAWVGIVKSGKQLTASNGASYYWAYVPADGAEFNLMSSMNEIQEGDYVSLPADEQALINLEKHQLMPGTYDVILFQDGGYTAVEKKTITVDAEYQITYMHGEKTIADLMPAVYRHLEAKDAAIPLPTAAQDGYTFAGWYESADFKGSSVTSIPKGSTGDKTYYGRFEASAYQVVFDTDGGSAVSAQSVKHDQCAVEPAAPKKDGFLFLDWVTTKNGTTVFDFNQPITGSTTAYALWVSEGTKMVKFETAGGSAVLNQAVQPGEMAKKPADPVRAHYTFDKWVTADGGTSAFNFDAPVTADTTVYAKWNPMDYEITFDVNGGNAVSKMTYTVESSNLKLPTPTRAGYVFKGWQDVEGKTYETITTGTAGNLALTAKWERETSLIVSNTTFHLGEAMNVNAYCTSDGAWVGLFRKDENPANTASFYWYYVEEHNGETVNILKQKKNERVMTPGAYKLVLFGDEGYGKLLKTVEITIVENPNPTKGTLTISGYSRNDKTYSGVAAEENGRTLYEYYYGDAIYAEAVLSGSNTEGAWIGVLRDEDYKAGKTSAFIGKNWFYVDDFAGQKVNLNYVEENVISENAYRVPYGLNYWIVLVSDNGTILDAEPINYRTFNMDWTGQKWGADVSSRLVVQTEWSSKLANGENQMPGVTLKQINGHFGLTKDETGKLVEITEEVLKQDEEYTLTYPAVCKDAGAYTIGVTFPSSGAKRNYLSTSSDNFGLKDGIPFYLTGSQNEHAISYHLNGGVNHAENPSLFNAGTEIILKSPNRNGYVFAGWYTTEDFQEGTQIEKIPADAAAAFVLYAKWISEDEGMYKINYVLNGGDNDLQNPFGYTGEVDVELKPARRAGYNFDGWFIDSAFTQPADVIQKGMTGDITLHAKFTKKEFSAVRIYTSVNGGMISGDARGNVGDTFTITYKPNNGYKLNTVKVDGVKVDIAKYKTSYTFENVTGDHSIAVVYKLNLAKAVMNKPVTGNGKIQISWKSVKRAKEYKVYRSKDNKTYKLIKTTSDLKYTDTKVNGGTKYYYKVAAAANGVIGTKSAAKSIKASKALTRAKITSISAKNKKVTLKWKKVTGADSYKVYRSADGGKTYKFVVKTKKTAYTTTKTQAAKKYHYKVVTVKNGIEGKLSVAKTITVKAAKTSKY